MTRYSTSILGTCVVSLCTSCTATRNAQEIRQSYEAPATCEVANSRAFEGVTFDKMWEAIIAFFASRQISIETLEKESGIVVAKKMLTMGSEGEGIVKLGDVTTKRQIVKQWLEPSQFQGSAVPSVVRATGRITKQEPVSGSAVTTVMPADCRAAVAFNVFVTRFAQAKLKVTMNVEVSTVDALQLYNGQIWRDYLDEAPLASAQQIINELRNSIQPTAVNPRPVTTGVLERAFFDHIEQALGSP